jgi:transcriptional regulator with XRE-family HTH domain
MAISKFYLELGKRIQHAREMKSLSQESAATLLGVTRVTWNHLERGNQRITIDRLISISHLLNISLFKLIPGISEESFDLRSDSDFSEEEKSLVKDKFSSSHFT